MTQIHVDCTRSQGWEDSDVQPCASFPRNLLNCLSVGLCGICNKDGTQADPGRKMNRNSMDENVAIYDPTLRIPNYYNSLNQNAFNTQGNPGQWSRIKLLISSLQPMQLVCRQSQVHIHMKHLDTDPQILPALKLSYWPPICFLLYHSFICCFPYT